MVQETARRREWRRGIRTDWLVVAAVAVLGAGLIGFVIGTNQSSVTIRSCRAYVAPAEATATCPDGWSYDIPVDNVAWSDSNSWHEGGRPSCLPTGPQSVDRITFASVDVTVNGRQWRPVIWISC